MNRQNVDAGATDLLPLPVSSQDKYEGRHSDGNQFRVPTGVAPTTSGDDARRRLGWGDKFAPPLPQREARNEYYRICDALKRELDEVDEFVSGGQLTDEGAGVVAEIEAQLEQLYDCQFGCGESLKAAVAAVQSQVNNAAWNVQHIRFLRNAVRYLRARSVIDAATVEEVNDLIEEHGLDVFRGTVSEPEVVRRYRIIEDSES